MARRLKLALLKGDVKFKLKVVLGLTMVLTAAPTFAGVTVTQNI